MEGSARSSVTVATASGTEVVEGTHVLMAAGRKPNISDLGLDAAGIKYEKRGITVGPALVTSNANVFAIGDVTGGLQFTHVANYHAGIVIRRALFKLPAKANNDVVPWVTYTEPELANVGLTEDAARAKAGKINVLRWPYHENDRAQAERDHRRPRQGRDRREGPHPRLLDRRRARRRADPDLVAGDLAEDEDQGDDRVDLALPDARRGQQARGLPLLRDCGQQSPGPQGDLVPEEVRLIRLRP